MKGAEAEAPSSKSLRGKFITFEGIDGSGKSTQLRLLAGELRQKGIDVITTHEPGGTPLGRRLREAFLETEENVDPMAELLLFAADRAQHVNLLIRPALEEGKIVLSDRYADATTAYQGAGRGFPADTVAEIIRLATGGLKPDLTLFFDLPIGAAINRAAANSADDRKTNRMDTETADFYTRVRDAYLKIAKDEPERVRTIDAARPMEDIHRDVAAIIDGFLNRK